jgi:hypothetical protein
MPCSLCEYVVSAKLRQFQFHYEDGDEPVTTPASASSLVPAGAGQFLSGSGALHGAGQGNAPDEIRKIELIHDTWGVRTFRGYGCRGDVRLGYATEERGLGDPQSAHHPGRLAEGVGGGSRAIA